GAARGEYERAGRLAGVDAALKDWRQGDCVLGEQWFVHRVDPALPLADGSNEHDLLETAERGLVVLTQSCDIVRECATRPYVEVAPVVEVDANVLEDVERGKRPGYGFIPALKGDCLVADLD